MSAKTAAMTHAYDRRLQRVNALRERLHAAIETDPADLDSANAIRAQLRDAKDAMVRVHGALTAEITAEIDAAPMQLSREPSGAIKVMQATEDGGRSRIVPVGTQEHATLSARLAGYADTDAQVAAVAYQVWGASVPVQISYYDDTAIVTDGGRRVRVRVSDLTVIQ